ncbi:MAG: 4-hydroxy-3-methylbut-2-enyl diphosphate reductase [Desulfobacterales bacterium]|nr:4-hydroxy-3-methylbut-2-enyl diphosphate reductase [Desulfobacterales bacterium]
MKISVAKTAGFCMGVRRAVDMVLDASNLSDEPIYTYGSLIHNPQVLNMLEEKGIFKIETIPEKGHGIVLIRAHGVPPEDVNALEKAGFKVINATCPRVVSVQVIINKYAEKGYSTIIIGDKKHPEVVGLLGYAKNRGHTVTSMDDFCALPVYEKAVVVAQTTQNTKFWEEITAWCNTHAPHYKLFNTICGSTEKRQTEIRRLAEKSDAVVVVGGRESGNTRRLAQIAAQTGKPAIHIEDAEEIEYEKLASAKNVAITAGASTPNWIIADTYHKIRAGLSRQRPAGKLISRVREFLIKTNMMAAFAAGSLAYACSILQGAVHVMDHALVAMFYVLSMQIMNNLFTVKSDKYNHPGRALFYHENRIYLWILAIVSGALGLYLSAMINSISFFILLTMSLLGLSYNLRIIPAMIVKKERAGRIRDLPGSKTILIILAWGTVTSLLPAVAHHSNPLSVIVVFLFSTGLVFARTAFFDILAIQGDRITGKETLPILLGEKKSFKIINLVLTANIGLILFFGFTDFLAQRAFLLAFIPLVMLLLLRFFEKNSLISGTHREFIVEFSIVAAGCVAAII